MGYNSSREPIDSYLNNPQNIETYGARLKEQRKKNGLTQAQLAERLEITKQALSKIEKGVLKSINYRFLQINCKILQCTDAYLLGVVDDVSMDFENYINPIGFDNYIGLKQELSHIEFLDERLYITFIQVAKSIKQTSFKRDLLLKILESFC